MNDSFYIEKNYFTDDEINEFIQHLTNLDNNSNLGFRVDGRCYASTEVPLHFFKDVKEFSFNDFWNYSDKRIEKIQQSYFTISDNFFHKKYNEKILNFVSDKYGVKKEEIAIGSSAVNIYTPGCYIEPHSDKGNPDDPKICSILIPLNTRPPGCVGGELKVDNFTYIPTKKDIISVTIHSEALHQVLVVENWIRCMLTIFVKKI